MLIAIHQPNYLPWLGYFHKIARAERFIFLDRAQFAKGSYTNRVQIGRDGAARWLTQPIRQRLGQPIADVEFADPAWPGKHLDALRGAYAGAPAFSEIWPALNDIYALCPATDLAAANAHLIVALAGRLEIATAFVVESALETGDSRGDDRLIALIDACASGATYLSGEGGQKYQDPAKFAAAGIELVYTDFTHPIYDQCGAPFVPGLSLVDVLFNLGWEQTSRLIARDLAVSG